MTVTEKNKWRGGVDIAKDGNFIVPIADLLGSLNRDLGGKVKWVKNLPGPSFQIVVESHMVADGERILPDGQWLVLDIKERRAAVHFARAMRRTSYSSLNRLWIAKMYMKMKMAASNRFAKKIRFAIDNGIL